jgi:hypothetical protein
MVYNIILPAFKQLQSRSPAAACPAAPTGRLLGFAAHATLEGVLGRNPAAAPPELPSIPFLIKLVSTPLVVLSSC